MITLELLKKKLWGALQSTVIWFNGVVMAVVPFLDYLQYQIPTVQAVLPENLYGWAFGSVAIANMFIRFFKTKQALEAKPLAKAME